MSTKFRDENDQLWLPFRLIWNDDERRPRSPIRITVGIVLVLIFANTGRNIQPTLLTGDNPIIDVVNTFVGGIPQAAMIILGVVLTALILDRRRITDLGLNFDPHSWYRFTGGAILGIGITALSIGVGTILGFYEITGIQLTGGPTVWVLLVIVTAFSQLAIVVAEELLARGYLLTNVLEGLDGFSSIPRNLSAGVAVAVSSLFFYFTHSARGATFGIMAGGLAVLLGTAYVLSGDLSIPTSIHFGVNFAGMIGGTAPQHASLIQLTSATTVTESLLLPSEAVAVRLVGAAIGVGVVLWWYYSSNGQIRVNPSVACPTLRWSSDRDRPTKQS